MSQTQDTLSILQHLPQVDNISEEKNMLRSDLSNQTSKLMDAKLLIVDLYEALVSFQGFFVCQLKFDTLKLGTFSYSNKFFI